MLQSWYWDYPKTAAGENWTDSINNQVEELALRGFTHLWLPPLSRASFGNGSNGYDPKDLYDLGEYNLGPTGFGTRAQVDLLISSIQNNGIAAVADVVYNHRDGGKAEDNSSVEGWIENYNCIKKNNGDNAYPSDRFRCYLPLGGSSQNGAGTYYIKLRSRTRHPDFNGKPYKFYCSTNVVGFQNITINENENQSGGNGGGDCGQNFITAPLGVDITATIDNSPSCDNGCGIDEYAITIDNNQFNASGDTLFIYFANQNGQYTDHYIHGLWSGSRALDIQSEIKYQTYTDFSDMPSGQGEMTHVNFKPNGNPTQLNGDWDFPYFFYDYDQNVISTKEALIDWSQWLMDSVGISGLRMDAVKHFDPIFVSDLLDSLYYNNQTPSMVVGEFYDSNPVLLRDWVATVENNMTQSARDDIQVRIFDFGLRDNLEKACDLFGYDARNLFTSGIVNGANGHKDQVVTFVNNHDFREGLQMVDNDPVLAYAYMLANPTIGIPTVFWPDYYGVDLPHGPDAFLKADIDRLIDIRNKYIVNASGANYLSRFSSPFYQNYISGFPNTSVIFQTFNGGVDSTESIVAINFAGDTLIVEIEVDTNVNLNEGSFLYEKTGKSFTPVLEVNGNHRVNLAIPPRSYAIWIDDTNAEISCGLDTIIYVDANATGLNNGSSWKNAYSSLNSVINLCSKCQEVKEIWLKEGTYKPTIFNDRNSSFYFNAALKLIGGFPSTGNPTIAQRNPDLYETILSGNIGSNNSTDNNYHVIRNYVITDTLTIDGITIRDGNANGTVVEELGGGVLNAGNLKLMNCKVTQNYALQGSALYNLVGSSTHLSNTIFFTNDDVNNTIKTDDLSKLIIETDCEIMD